MPTLTLEDLTAQIKQLEDQKAQLQAEAEKQRQEAKAAVIQELMETIEIYDITAKDLGLSVGKAGITKRGRKSSGAKVGGTGKKHTGPDGQTWSEGTRGRKPAWLVQQLAEGNASNGPEGE